MTSERRQETSSSLASGYRKLIAWQTADDLAYVVYEITTKFPKSEMYGLVSQLRRAALSVPANVIEGYARMSKKEFRHFLSIALGSLSEVEYFLYFSFKQNMISEKDYINVSSKREQCGKVVWGLYQSLNLEKK